MFQFLVLLIIISHNDLIQFLSPKTDYLRIDKQLQNKLLIFDHTQTELK